MLKYFLLAIIVGAVASEPIKRAIYTPDIDQNLVIHTAPEIDLQSISEVLSNSLDLSIKPSGISFLIDLVSAVFQYKASAISIAIGLIEWAMSNILLIGFGAVAIIGLCKVTGCCQSSLYDYVPVTQIQTLATPQVIDQAERFLYTAFERYAEKRKREI